MTLNNFVVFNTMIVEVALASSLNIFFLIRGPCCMMSWEGGLQISDLSDKGSGGKQNSDFFLQGGRGSCIF